MTLNTLASYQWLILFASSGIIISITIIIIGFILNKLNIIEIGTCRADEIIPLVIIIFAFGLLFVSLIILPIASFHAIGLQNIE